MFHQLRSWWKDIPSSPSIRDISDRASPYPPQGVTPPPQTSSSNLLGFYTTAHTGSIFALTLSAGMVLSLADIPSIYTDVALQTDSSWYRIVSKRGFMTRGASLWWTQTAIGKTASRGSSPFDMWVLEVIQKSHIRPLLASLSHGRSERINLSS